MHGEAYKLSLANKFLKGKLSRHVDKIIVIQKGLSKMKLKIEALEKALEDSSCNTKTITISLPS